MPAPGSRAEMIGLIAAAICLVGGLLTFITARDSAPMSIESTGLTTTTGARQ